jgi:hypothetical protein
VARRLVNFLTLLSLLLCMATTAVWVRSYWRWDAPGVVTEGGARWLPSGGGRFALLAMDIPATEGGWLFSKSDPRYVDPAEHNMEELGAILEPDWEWGFAGFAAAASHRPALSGLRIGRIRFAAGAHDEGCQADLRWLIVPYWSLAACTAALPGLWLARRLRRARAAAGGRCPSCGYDLRATPDRCPECGATTSTPPIPAP